MTNTCYCGATDCGATYPESSNMSFKGFHLAEGRLTCRDHTFEIGVQYAVEPPVKLCEKGFHSGRKVRDAMHYYPPGLGTSLTVYGRVSIDGHQDTEPDKLCSERITLTELLDGQICPSLCFKQGLLHCETGPAYIANGFRYWYLEGQLRRIEEPDGTVSHYKDGYLHLSDGPAKTDADGSQEWYHYGYLHRVDGPAIISESGQRWYYLGKLHRVGGPAITDANGQKWYYNGVLHREGGPAVIGANGTEAWYIHGVRIKLPKGRPVGNIKCPYQDLSPAVGRYYDESGRLHRLDGPAVVEASGCQMWYLHGKLHREDGPAVITKRGQLQYFRNGRQYWP